MSDANTNPRRSRRGLIAAVAFFGVVILLAAGALIGRAIGGEDPDPTGSSTATPSGSEPATSPSGTAEQTAGGDCAAAASGDDERPTEPPTDIEFEQVSDSRYAAISDQYGPTVRDDDGVYRCYDRSPAGALLSAVNFVAHWTSRPESGYDPRLVADGPERQLLEIEGPVQSSNTDRIIGFSVSPGFDDAGNASSGIVSLLVSSQEGTQGVFTFTMVWEGDDWKVLPAPNTAELYQFGDEPTLSDFVLWEPSP